MLLGTCRSSHAAACVAFTDYKGSIRLHKLIILMLLLLGMETERHDGLSNGNRIPDQTFSAGADAYYHHPPLQQHGSQETTQYHTTPQMHSDSAYSRQSSFEAPSEQASYVAPPQPPPTARKQSQRQRSGNLSMLRVSHPSILTASATAWPVIAHS